MKAGPGKSVLAARKAASLAIAVAAIAALWSAAAAALGKPFLPGPSATFAAFGRLAAAPGPGRGAFVRWAAAPALRPSMASSADAVEDALQLEEK